MAYTHHPADQISKHNRNTHTQIDTGDRPQFSLRVKKLPKLFIPI